MRAKPMHGITPFPPVPAGAPAQATLREVCAASAADGAVRAFVLSHLDPTNGPVLWAQDRITRREAGEPYLPGIGREFGLIRIDVNRPADVLWAMEQALECRSLGAVLGEIWGEAAVADFTATKRLALRAEAHGVPCWLIRRAARPDLSAARERWRVAAAPSLPHPDDDMAPGLPVWQAELFRARTRPPGRWEMSWNRLTRQRSPAGRGQGTPAVPVALQAQGGSGPAA
jgi:protein ImuA